MKKKRTIVSKLQEQLEHELKKADLMSVGGGRITICGTGSDIRAVTGDHLAY